jgi:ATP-dependent RNA helicase RhlE
MLFSATIESSVKHLVETHVRNAVRIEVGSTTKPVEQVDLHLYEVEQDRKLGLLQTMLRDEAGSFWSSPAPSTAPTGSRRSSRTKA